MITSFRSGRKRSPAKQKPSIPAKVGGLGGLLLLLCIILFPRQPASAQSAPPIVDITTETFELAQSTCSDTFLTHDLDFTTGNRVRDISTYLSNGAGVAAGDLDDDGDLDLVFASVDRNSEILWNQGNLVFKSETLDDSFTRGVAIVDVDGDGALDLVFTHRGLEPISFWHNTGADGDGRFDRQPLPGVTTHAYAMGWRDLNGDGLLDLVTGSYGAELTQRGVEGPQDDGSTGVIVHLQQEDGSFDADVLDPEAETLSIGLVDMTGDGQAEIWVANDFAMRDQVWMQGESEWSLIDPFSQTSHSTMSLEWGDILNRGKLAYFTTDMAPYDSSPEVLAQWQPLMDAMGMGDLDMHDMSMHHEEGDPQIMANVLQMPSRRSGLHNQAPLRGVAHTGWTWATRFGDLDSDGYLDLYSVNGVIASDMFGHLHNDELIEENQAFRNHGNGVFVPVPEWSLGSISSGRGMIMGDMDGDGDLDIVVNNLRGYAQLFENQLCGGDNLLVDLRWDGTSNLQAIGAEVRLKTSMGTLTRDVRASGSYLSDNPTTMHFGLPSEATIEQLEIVWPDGAISSVGVLPSPSNVMVTRTDDSQ